jgi:hypothetical protein
LINKETKVSKTKQEIEEGQLLLKMFRRIVDGVDDMEIMKELKINDSKLYYYYKQILIETSKIIQSKKFQKSMTFELEMLKDRMLKIYRMLEERVSDPTTSLSEVAQCASQAADLATYIFRLQVEGSDAVIGEDNFFDIMKERQGDLADD